MSRPPITSGSWPSGGAQAANRWTRWPSIPNTHGSELHGQQFGLLVQRLGVGPAQMHVDIHTDDLEAEVARLEGLGAQRVQRLHHWRVMRDPAGLPFCVLPDPPGKLTSDNAHRWE